MGLLEAFDDRKNKGFNWNNMMLQRWVDHNGDEHRVLDDYNRNVHLIDLTQQPQEIKDFVDNHIDETVEEKHQTMVGAKFLKFCGKYELNKVADNADKYAEFLQAGYTK